MAISKEDKIFNCVNYTVLLIIALLCLYPFIYMLALSLNSGRDTLRGGITIYPRDFTLANYGAILRDKLILSAYKITILRTIIGTISNVFITALVAYGLSEQRLPGRKYIMIYMVIPMFFGGGLIPYYLVLREYRLLNTFWVYIIPGLFSIWNCIVMKTSFQGIPQSLKESMRIDGANELQIFFKVIFPLSLPMFAAISLFVAVGHWNDWFTGAYFVQKTELVPVQTYLQMIMTRDMRAFLEKDLAVKMSQELMGKDLTDYSKITSFSLRIAAVLVGTLPILFVYPFLQKYFVKGVLIGSIKG
ncbi:MAG: carbohydrate ABC transporter permease [Clostridiaceae bacterium]|nr:carbohydrate ABC transporter permease [Clostridiaceae bacterium]